MLFDDEKDVIDDNADIQISDDGTVTWDDVLNSSEDDLVSTGDSALGGDDLVSSKGGSVDLGDDLELVEDGDDDIDDQELAQILSNDSSQSSYADDEYTTGGQEEDFDIDTQLSNASKASAGAGHAQPGSAGIKPRKELQQQKSSGSGFFKALVFALIVCAGVYFYMQHANNIQFNQSAMQTPLVQDPQTQDVQQGDIAQQVAQEPIPVVNEEEVDEIKPDQQNEKKQVIDVRPTGRTNPFLPIQKYLNVDAPTVDFSRAGIPQPPETYGIKDEVTEKMMTIAVSGIMYDEVKPSAIITLDSNDYFVQKGDRLDDYKIVDITRNSVTIQLGKNTYKANIGEEFKIDEFYGNARYLPSQLGGGRQYYSVSDDRNNTASSRSTVPSGRRYVSEEEVQINAR